MCDRNLTPLGLAPRRWEAGKLKGETKGIDEDEEGEEEETAESVFNCLRFEDDVEEEEREEEDDEEEGAESEELALAEEKGCAAVRGREAEGGGGEGKSEGGTSVTPRIVGTEG